MKLTRGIKHRLIKIARTMTMMMNIIMKKTNLFEDKISFLLKVLPILNFLNKSSLHE